MTVATALATASQASAQLTTQRLIGSSVSQVGPRFSDVNEAIKRFQNGDVGNARIFLDKAKEKNPELPPTEITLARMFYFTKNAARGRQLLEQAVMKHPDDPEPYLIFAEQAVRKGRATDASFLYEKAHALNQQYEANGTRKRNMEIRCHSGPANIALGRRDWQDAKARLEVWLAIDPDNTDIMQHLGRAQFMLNDARAAYESFGNAVKVDKKLPSAALMLAQLYHQKDDQANATKFFENALNSGVNNAATQIAYARWLIESDNYRKAKSHLDVALNDEPDSVQALVLRSVVSWMEDNFNDAEKYLSRAHLHRPDLIEPTNQLALLLIEQNDKVQKVRAQRFAMMNRQLFPEDANTGITLAWVLYNNNQRNQAAQILQAALKQRGAGLDSNYFTAKILSESGNQKIVSRLLKASLSGRGIFLHRKEAQELLDKITAEWDN